MGTERTVVVRPAFVDVVPQADLMEDDVLYVSLTYTTAIHKCACRCGQEVVTPISPEEWSLTYNGEAISLTPSIGNWRMPCQSHYWIQDSRIIWVPDKKYRGFVSLLRRTRRFCRGLREVTSASSFWRRSEPVPSRSSAKSHTEPPDATKSDQ